MKYEYVGYHGTDSDCVADIKKDNFRISQNDDDWLGYGVYFFVEGISNPVENASEWAKNQAFHRGSYAYESFTILKATTRCNAILDTTTTKGLQIYNKARELLIEKHNKYFYPGRKFQNDDRIIWNLVASFMELEVIIHNLYIKNKRQRILKIGSNVPNTTVMCVKEPTFIDKSTIEVETTGRVRG